MQSLVVGMLRERERESRGIAASRDLRGSHERRLRSLDGLISLLVLSASDEIEDEDDDYEDGQSGADGDRHDVVGGFVSLATLRSAKVISAIHKGLELEVLDDEFHVSIRDFVTRLTTK